MPISGAALGSIRETSTVTTIGKTIFSVLETGTELTHDDLAVLLAGQRLHNRRLNDRNQRHVGICGDSDRSQQTRSQFGGDIDSGRTVRAADDADRTGFSGREAQQQRYDERQEDAQLSGSAKQQTHRVGDQRTKVGHRADAHEDERRDRCPA